MNLTSLDISFAFSVGVASFFSPCSAGLLPAYVGYFVGMRSSKDGKRDLPRTIIEGLKLGGAASLGTFLLILPMSILLHLLPKESIPVEMWPWIGIAVAAAITLLGFQMLQGNAPTLPLKIHLGERSLKNVFLFGIVYSLASLGCTFPIFLSLVLDGFLKGPAEGVASLLVYAAGMSSLLVGVTLLLALGNEGMGHFLRRAIPWVNKASAVVLVIAGLIIGKYWIDIMDALS